MTLPSDHDVPNRLLSGPHAGPLTVGQVKKPRGAWIDTANPNGPRKASYTPLLCVGYVDGPGDVVVIAKREATVFEGATRAVIALWLNGSDFSIRYEMVLASQFVATGSPDWFSSVGAWPLLGPRVAAHGGNLHVGIQRGAQVNIYSIHRGTRAASPEISAYRSMVAQTRWDY